MESIKCCDQCHKPLTLKRKRFCSTKCKDRYHNIHNPRGYYAPGKESTKNIIPQTTLDTLHLRSYIADMRADEEDCGDKDHT
jgi:hypothetical protein